MMISVKPGLSLTLSFLLLIIAMGLNAAENTEPAPGQGKEKTQNNKPKRPKGIYVLDKAGIKQLEGAGWRKDLPNYLVIGDSISLHMMRYLVPALKGKVNVFHCGGQWGCNATNTERSGRDGWLSSWLSFGGVYFSGRSKAKLNLNKKEATGKIAWSVISANWGLWDTKGGNAQDGAVPLDQYRQNLDEHFGKMKATGATVIWVTTTPVPKGAAQNRTDEKVLRYNAAAAKLVDKHKLEICDLYTAIKEKEEEMKTMKTIPDHLRRGVPTEVHFGEKGREFCGKFVAQAVLQALKQRASESDSGETEAPADSEAEAVSKDEAKAPVDCEAQAASGN